MHVASKLTTSIERCSGVYIFYQILGRHPTFTWSIIVFLLVEARPSPLIATPLVFPTRSVKASSRQRSAELGHAGVWILSTIITQKNIENLEVFWIVLGRPSKIFFGTFHRIG